VLGFQSYSFCNSGPNAQFHSPRITPSGRKLKFILKYTIVGGQDGVLEKFQNPRITPSGKN
jgi:hypothetical protein